MTIIRGKVIAGKKRGLKLGFPTANVKLRKNIPEGIYISECIIAGKVFRSATFIGSAKTFNERDSKSETFILDFNGNLYNKWITVKLIKKIRENIKFNSEEGLILQMQKDITYVKNYFAE